MRRLTFCYRCKALLLLAEDSESINIIIQEKTEEFINIMGVALGNKNNAQKLSSNFNHTGMEYHLLDNNMIEKSSSFSSEGSTFTKGCVNLKTELFFSNHRNLFGLLQKPDNQSTGIYYLTGNLIRDMKGLLKNEIMYNETYPVMEKGHKLKKSDLDLLDKISDLILTENIQELKDLDKKLF